MAKRDFANQNVASIDYPMTPFDQVKQELSGLVAPSSLPLIPKKWEKIGDVLILKLPPELEDKDVIAEAYARVLKCRTVMEDTGGIKGVKREPELCILYGDENTETIHVENGVYFKLDVSGIMFSSGNIDERIRMATVSSPHETVVDFFSGIGYFTIPMAVYSFPRIFACELNPVAYGYLLENIRLNQVDDRVTGLLGDCRKIAPHHVADRIIMGYFDSFDFLPYAFRVLKRKGGIIHYHELYPTRLLANYHLEKFNEFSEVAHEYHWHATILHSHKIKSYNPCLSHVVADVLFH